jgi:hypothetical protein
VFLVHIKPTLKGVKLKDLTPPHVRILGNDKQRSRSSRTVRYVHVTCIRR